MRRVKAQCPSCGPVLVRVEDVKVLVTNARARGARYAFTCSTCAAPRSLPATRDDVVLLMRGGVMAIIVPLEVLERTAAAQLPALCEHEIGAFCDQLDSLDELAIAAAAKELS